MSKKDVIYIGGPMRGIPYYNYQAFIDAAARIRAAGFEVISPAELDMNTGFDPWKMDLPPGFDWTYVPEGIPHISLRECMARDCKVITEQCTGIYLLTGWQHSQGANAEYALARSIGLFRLDPVTLVRHAIPKYVFPGE